MGDDLISLCTLSTVLTVIALDCVGDMVCLCMRRNQPHLVNTPSISGLALRHRACNTASRGTDNECRALMTRRRWSPAKRMLTRSVSLHTAPYRIIPRTETSPSSPATRSNSQATHASIRPSTALDNDHNTSRLVLRSIFSSKSDKPRSAGQKEPAQGKANDTDISSQHCKYTTSW